MVTMNLGITGEKFVSHKVEYSAVLHFSGDYVLRIESAFTLRINDHDYALSPEKDPPKAFQPLALLVGQKASASSANDTTGELTIKLANGASIHVEPDEDFEAWTVAGPNGMHVVSMPGGGLAVWSPEE
jgi:hypothetical protein